MRAEIVETKKEIDSRIEDGYQVGKTVVEPGYKVIEEIISSLRDEAKYMVLAVNVESVKWRERLNTLDEVLGIPQQIIKKAKLAQQEEHDE